MFHISHHLRLHRAREAVNSGLRGTRLIRLTPSLLLHNVIGHEVMAEYIRMRHLCVRLLSLHYAWLNLGSAQWRSGWREPATLTGRSRLTDSATDMCPTMLTHHCYTHTQKKIIQSEKVLGSNRWLTGAFLCRVPDLDGFPLGFPGSFNSPKACRAWVNWLL